MLHSNPRSTIRGKTSSSVVKPTGQKLAKNSSKIQKLTTNSKKTQKTRSHSTSITNTTPFINFDSLTTDTSSLSLSDNDHISRMGNNPHQYNPNNVTHKTPNKIYNTSIELTPTTNTIIPMKHPSLSGYTGFAPNKSHQHIDLVDLISNPNPTHFKSTPTTTHSTTRSIPQPKHHSIMHSSRLDGPITTSSMSFHSKQPLITKKTTNSSFSSTLTTTPPLTQQRRKLNGKWTPAPGTPGADGQQSDEHLETLNKFCIELTQEAKEGRLDPMIGRLDILSRCVEVLSRRRKNNPILTGEPGTGKTAIIEGLAQAIVSGQVPQQLQGKKIYSLDMAQLVAGATYRGEFEERLTKLIKALEVKDDAILFVDEVHLLVGAGKTEGAMDAANMLKPVLARGKIRFMGATTTKEYTQHIEKDGALARRFETIHVPEPSVDDCMTILRGLKPKYEQHHKVMYRDSAIVAAAQMAKRYFTDRRLPDKAIDLLDEAGAHVGLQSNTKPKVLTNMEQDYYRLKMELESLQNDKDPGVVSRRHRLQQLIDKVRKKIATKETEWKLMSTLRDEARDAEQQVEDISARAQALLKSQMTASPQEQLAIKRSLSTQAALLNQMIKQRDETKARYDAYLANKKKEAIAKGLNPDEDQQSTDVTYDVIARVVALHTGVPVSKLLVKDKEKLLNLEDELRKRVVAQDHALTAVSTCVRVARAGLHNGSRPQGVFLFCGPSGVGKTELCKALAENLFGSSDAMVRLDMSEYSEAHTVSRLIGAAPGYIGYEEGGQLTEAVRKRPYQVVLLDEIEKAHKQVHTVLLQVMEEASLTDGKGNKVDFSNTIFIMTSNLGAHEAAQYKTLNPHLDTKQLQNDIMTRAVKQYFPPEFVNRLDDTIFFNSLAREHMNPIVKIQLDKVADLLDDHKSSLVVSDGAMNHLGDRGFQPEYGARPIKRAIYRNVTQVLAEGILAGAIPNHSLVTMKLKEEMGDVQHNFKLESEDATILDELVKSADPAYTYTVFKQQVENNQKSDRFSWESDDEIDDVFAGGANKKRIDSDDSDDSDDTSSSEESSENENRSRSPPPPPPANPRSIGRNSNTRRGPTIAPHQH
jgi:ATP-dependent Clp protease ATP-binding subunit ClpB